MWSGAVSGARGGGGGGGAGRKGGGRAGGGGGGAGRGGAGMAGSYMAPASLDALLSVRAAHPQAQIVAGCTDVGLWVTKQHRQFGQVLDVTRARELRRVEDYPNHIAIGAA